MQDKKIGLFTGSFDPITVGHLDLIKRASQLFDTLYVGLFKNSRKKAFLSFEERSHLLSLAVEDLPNVKVITSNNLVVEVAKDYQVTHLVRGIRNATDLNYESEIAFYNKHLEESIETIYLLANPHYQYISSSRVRELWTLKADISDFVPSEVASYLEKKR